MSKIAFASLCLSALGLTCLIAQDEPPSQAVEQHAAVIVRAESDDGGEIHTIEMATSDGGDFFTFAPNVGGAVMFGGGNPLEASEFLLNNPGVQKELEILDGQSQQIKQMQSEFGNEIKSRIDEVMKSGGPGKDRIGEVIQEINQRKKERMAEILLPHQIDRLKQISLQMNVNQTGLGQALASKALAEQLGIDEKQQEQLAKKADELSKEFEEKVAKLKTEMRDELLGELKPDQREKVELLMGQKFEFENQPNRAIRGPRGMRSSTRQSKPSDN